MRESLTFIQRRFWKYFFLRIVIRLSSQELMSCGRSLIQTLFLNRYFLLTTIVLTNLWNSFLIKTVSSWLQFRRGVYISFEEKNSNRCTDLQVKRSIPLFLSICYSLQDLLTMFTRFNWVSWYAVKTCWLLTIDIVWR